MSNEELRTLYSGIMELQKHLAERHHDAEIGCLDYKAVKALAATYELQDYLAGKLAMIEDPEDDGEVYGLLELIKQIPDRGFKELTPKEMRYINAWDKAHVSHSLFRAAYDRTLVMVGSLSWSYLDVLLKHWRQMGLVNAEDVGRFMRERKAHGHPVLGE